MNSVLPAAEPGGADWSPTTSLIREAEQLVSKHGDGADVVAARLADASFASGDRAAGFHWSKIFVILAVAHIRSARTVQAPA
jgi:hypothetical protein